MEYTLKFIIRDDRVNKIGRCPLYLRYTFRRKFINLPVKYSISPNFWNKEDGKPHKNYPNYKKLKALLDEFEERVTESIDRHINREVDCPDSTELKDILSGRTLSQIQQGSTLTLSDRFKDYYDYQDKDGVSSATKKIYSYTWNKWIEFEKQKKHSFDYKEMNFNNLNDFRIFLKSQGLQVNSVSKYLKTMKSFLSYLVLHKELEVPVSYKKVAIEKEEPEIQVLTQEELEILKRETFFSRSIDHQKPVSGLNDREKLIGQVLFFLCHTGLAYADFDKLKVGNLIFLNQSKSIKNLQIHITRKKLKTVANCRIPILDVTIDLIMDIMGIPHEFIEPSKDEPAPLQIKISILESFIKKSIKKGEMTLNSRIFPRVISQVFNREIKDLMKKIGVDSLVRETRFYGGIEKTESVPKYKLISAHTGRRTFITRSIENGVSHLVLMDMTGHTKVQTLARYNKNSPEFIQREVKSKTPGQIEFKLNSNFNDGISTNKFEEEDNSKKKK